MSTETSLTSPDRWHGVAVGVALAVHDSQCNGAHLPDGCSALRGVDLTQLVVDALPTPEKLAGELHDVVRRERQDALDEVGRFIGEHLEEWALDCLPAEADSTRDLVKHLREQLREALQDTC